MKRGQHKPGSDGARLAAYHEGPLPPWEERARRLLNEIHTAPYYSSDRHTGRRRARRYQRDRDVIRAIAEGLIEVKGRRSGTFKRMRLTDAGRAMIETPAKPEPTPWAKRRALIAELKAMLRTRGAR